MYRKHLVPRPINTVTHLNRRNQAGSASVVMMACVSLVIVLCLFMADVGLYLAAKQMAQNAADA
ncbi:MAG: pilus assembly protein TadG-related protein, partial [Actinobacteria bacterium]|nr:pilus assembly protein TadG-related protein [Actinomycetota bacterium]